MSVESFERPVTPDVAEVIRRVAGHLEDLIDALDRDGARYAAEYARWLHCGRRRHAPPKPPSLHHKAAACIRDLVLDEAHAARRGLGS